MDYPLNEGRFTWTDNQTPPSFSRIDRFLVSLDWDEHFADAIQSAVQPALPRVLSDHKPILLKCGGVRRGRSPFRFENMWLKSEGFVEQVKAWWESFDCTGAPSFVFAQKLKALKVRLKVWNKEVFGDIRYRKQNLLRELQALDVNEEIAMLSTEDNVRKEEVKEES